MSKSDPPGAVTAGPDAIDNQLEQTLRRYVTDEGEYAAVARGEPFYTATSLDSVSYLELVVELEETFQVSFDDADAQQVFSSLDQLTGFIRARMAS